MEDKLLEQFLGHLPGLREYIDYVELSTRSQLITLCVRWLAQSTASSRRLSASAPNHCDRSPIKNLYMAGSEVASVGVIGAMMGGVLSVLSAEPVGTAKMLKEAGFKG